MKISVTIKTRMCRENCTSFFTRATSQSPCLHETLTTAAITSKIREAYFISFALHCISIIGNVKLFYKERFYLTLILRKHTFGFNMDFLYSACQINKEKDEPKGVDKEDIYYEKNMGSNGNSSCNFRNDLYRMRKQRYSNQYRYNTGIRKH